MSEASPERGEVWWVQLDPVVGSELGKRRPALVLTSNRFASLPVRIVVPFTSWQPKFERQLNKVFVPRTELNGLNADSAADVLQLRTVAISRLVGRVGVLETWARDEVVAGVLFVLGLHSGSESS